MLKRRPLLLIAVCAWAGLITACQVVPAPVSVPTPAAVRNEAPALTQLAPSAIPVTPQPSVTLTPTVTPTLLPPTITASATDPFSKEDPEGKVLHSALKRRDGTPQPPMATENQSIIEKLLKLVNAERAKVGAPPLEMSPILQQTAQDHCDDMAQHNFFGHSSPNGLGFVERIKNAGYKYTAASENLFAGNGPYNTPEYVIKVWLNSPSHRENMLSFSYTEVGIGYRFNPDSTYGGYFTADFGHP